MSSYVLVCRPFRPAHSRAGSHSRGGEHHARRLFQTHLHFAPLISHRTAGVLAGLSRGIHASVRAPAVLCRVLPQMYRRRPRRPVPVGVPPYRRCPCRPALVPHSLLEPLCAVGSETRRAGASARARLSDRNAVPPPPHQLTPEADLPQRHEADPDEGNNHA